MMNFAEKKPERMETLAHARGVLSTHGWLSERDRDFRDRILGAGTLRRYAAGETLYFLGDEPNGIFGIVEGSVSISIPSDSGSDFVATRADRGFWIGDLALFSDAPRLVTVAAVTDALTLFVPSHHLRQMVAEEPAHYRDFYALTYQNMSNALRLLANLSVAGSERRLGLRLLQYDETHRSAGQWLELSQDDLARMSALSPPTLHRTLKKLAEKGMVEVGYARIRIRDRDALAAMCRD